MFKNVSMGPSDHSKNSSKDVIARNSQLTNKEESKASKILNDKDKADSQFNMFSSQQGDDDEEEDDDLEVKASDLIFQPESMRRKWLKNHGKAHYIDFSDNQLHQLRSCFNSLDDDGSEAIGVDELEDPLIALGLVENRSQVQQLVQAVDADGSQQIEFEEFLDIIKGGSKTAKEEPANKQTKKSGAPSMEASTGAIYKFFKSLTNGELISKEKQNMPFNLFISAHRRQMIIDAMMSNNGSKQKEGERIMQNYKKQLAERFARQRIDRNMANPSVSGASARSSKAKEEKVNTLESSATADPEVLKAILNRKDPNL